jgi:dynein heavy chain
LEDQLLVDVVRSERPELEQKRDELIISISADKKQLKSTEDKILKMLANATGNILDDEGLIDNLQESKVMSNAIGERMLESEKTNADISKAREGYRSVATRGSALYFVVASLANIDPMYQYSLQYFHDLYVMRIERSEKSSSLPKRIEILMEDITTSVYRNISRGLFERHKLIFSFQVAVNISLEAGDISAEELKMLLLGTSLQQDSKVLDASENEIENWRVSAPQWWARADRWTAILQLSKDMNDSFAGLPEAIANCSSLDLNAIAEELGLTKFQQLLVKRITEPEMLVHGVRQFVMDTLGKLFVSPPPFDLQSCYDDSSNSTPLIFILSSGADPMSYLQQLAIAKGKKRSMRIVSLGQGQGPLADKHIREGSRDGTGFAFKTAISLYLG